MLAKVAFAKQISKEIEVVNDATDTARKALEFAKNYVRNAEKAERKEKEVKAVVKKVEVKSVKKEDVKTPTPTEEIPEETLPIRDLSKIDIIAQALAKLDKHFVEPEVPAPTPTPSPPKKEKKPRKVDVTLTVQHDTHHGYGHSHADHHAPVVEKPKVHHHAPIVEKPKTKVQKETVSEDLHARA